MATLADNLAAELERQILAGDPPIGEKLPAERALAESFQVNRNVVREALKKLEQLGLVEIRRGSGTTVRDYLGRGGIDLLRQIGASGGPLPRRIAGDMLDFRIAYAAGMAELAALRAPPEKVWDLRARLMQLRAQTSAESWANAERAVIQGIVDASENLVYGFLQNTFAEALKGQAAFAKVLFQHREEVERGYDKVLTAIAAHAPQRANNAMRALMQEERSWFPP